MSDERIEELSSEGGHHSDAEPSTTTPQHASGEAVAAHASADDTVSTRTAATGDEPGAPQDLRAAKPAAPASPAKLRLRDLLPALDDDDDVGVQKEHIVTRDGKADLLFTGTLLASAAPASAPKGSWQEYRIYQTAGGKHVFSKLARTITEGQNDTHEADVFDPNPASVPSQLIRSAREIARNKPLTWMDAAVAFFGYDPLAKSLYRKLSARFEEHVS